jgi:hypothetical protein
MPGLDDEVVERVRRWCAEAGRQTASPEIHAALGGLSWDELLAVKALLADPPPARPLGPFALADVARGAPPDLAADRERSGRYRPEAEREAGISAATAPRRAAPPALGSGRRPAGPSVVVRRVRDRAPVTPTRAPPLPTLETLRAPAGRGVLERLLRRHGARRAALAAALAQRWRRPDGLAPGEADLAELLDHHGLARAFASRERDEVLHALRAAGGLRARAAERLGTDAAGLDAALARLGAAGEAETIRAERRAELRARATLAERAALLLREGERLADLGLSDEFERDLAARLPGHLRALAADPGQLAVRLSGSLGLSREEVVALAARFGIALGAPASAPAGRSSAGRSPRGRPPGGRSPTGRSAGRPPTRPPRPGPPRGARTAPRRPRGR